MAKGHKKLLGDLELLDEIDGTVPAAEDSGDDNVAPAEPKIQIKYICKNPYCNGLEKLGSGYVLRNAAFFKLAKEGTQAATTGIEIQIPKGYRGRIVEPSGLTLNKHITIAGGIIDAGIRDIKVILVNRTAKVVEIPERTTVGILYIEKAPEVQLLQVPSLKTSFAQANKMAQQFEGDADAFRRITTNGSTPNAMLGGVMSRNK